MTARQTALDSGSGADVDRHHALHGACRSDDHASDTRQTRFRYRTARLADINRLPALFSVPQHLLTYENSCAYNELQGVTPNGTILTRSILSEQQEEKQEMENEVKPTWKLAWGLWWRMFLIGLGVSAVVGVIMYLVAWTLMLRFIPW